MRTSSATAAAPGLDPLRRFLRKPKGLLIVFLAGLAGIATWQAGPALVAPGLLAALATAALIDAPILRWRQGRWSFPDGAVLTGLIVAMILSAHEPWPVVALTTAIGVASKYLLRTRTANIFNPAALALLANYFLFGSGQSWWGALSETSGYALPALVATGLFIAERVSRIPGALAFLGGYYLLFTLAAFLGDPAHVAGAFRPPDLQAALFFALFMVTDPPTSPPRPRDQLIYGAIVAGVSGAVFAAAGSIYYLLVGLLVANIWEAWRRARTHSSSRA